MKEFVPVVILITTSMNEEAEEIANKLLTQRKAACVNIIPKVRSLFRWQGEIDSADEAVLVVKSKASLVDEIVSLVKEAHSYQVPEVIALPIIGGNRDYLNWMSDELGD
jgi:periplasmic divalent cation tolerance protein